MDDASLVEIIVNKYEPGDYISTHKDYHDYIYNMVINIQDSEEDGIIIEDTFYPDRMGRCVVFKYSGLNHSVPPVKNKRYVLIYLYRKNEYV
jgi:hypothetical protein